MKRTTLFWTLSVIVTIGSALYQRMTGPTYPLSGSSQLHDVTIKYKLSRSHGGETDCPVTIAMADSSVTGVVMWKRFKTQDDWTSVPMTSKDGSLTAMLPHQPPAGKLMYRVELQQGATQIQIPEHEPVVVRFKGDTPLWVIIPHVLAMFVAMLLSTRTGLEFFNPVANIKWLLYATLGVLFVGGFILGPTMQWYAFGAWWTGWPFGYDLTDNKTLIAFIGWLIAFAAYFKAKNPKRWMLAASVLMLVVYLIPHSVMGSELDYNKLEKEKSGIEQPK